jgi:hypothetical protein
VSTSVSTGTLDADKTAEQRLNIAPEALVKDPSKEKAKDGDPLPVIVSPAATTATADANKAEETPASQSAPQTVITALTATDAVAAAVTEAFSDPEGNHAATAAASAEGHKEMVADKSEEEINSVDAGDSYSIDSFDEPEADPEAMMVDSQAAEDQPTQGDAAATAASFHFEDETAAGNKATAEVEAARKFAERYGPFDSPFTDAQHDAIEKHAYNYVSNQDDMRPYVPYDEKIHERLLVGDPIEYTDHLNDLHTCTIYDFTRDGIVVDPISGAVINFTKDNPVDGVIRCRESDTRRKMVDPNLCYVKRNPTKTQELFLKTEQQQQRGIRPTGLRASRRFPVYFSVPGLGSGVDAEWRCIRNLPIPLPHRTSRVQSQPTGTKKTSMFHL